MIYQGFIKRTIDILISFILIILLLPLFVLVSILILLLMGRPILFIQTRPGKNKTPFKIFKFRTMISIKGMNDDDRVTNLGEILRKLSLDELPQLLNVLNGSMSLIGPRPLLTEYNDYFSSKENKRFCLKPGISGLAQVNGRNNLSWDQKLKLDVKYVENINFYLDLKIFFLTIFVILSSTGFKKSGESKNFIESKKDA